MAPLVVLVATFLVLLLLGRFGVRALRDPLVCLRGALCAMFLLTASAHFGSRRPDLVRMVPSMVPHPEFWVTFTGVAEIAGAVGLLLPRLAPWASAGLTLLLLAVFPANLHAASHHLTIGGVPVPAAGPRTLIQLVFLAAVLAAGFGHRWRARGPAKGHDSAVDSAP
ncbi:DoxX family protein [Pendulispora albinea]|uniref:DoxX family protein n=1 Tax=Pendulispora albinea TaxID=2741071 RepID=A0ABZ2LPM4_9BACT